MNNNITLALAKAYVNEKMSGVSGVKGDTGVSVTDVAINSNNHLIITLSDKSSIDAGLIETVAGKDGAPGADGKDGQPGKDGADGYTPIKGTDYFTEADKSEMVSDVIAALPKYNGEVVAV